MTQRISIEFYTQNDDHPGCNDLSFFEYNDGVVTLGCNDWHRSYKTSGQAPTAEALRTLEAYQDGNALNAEDPSYPFRLFGLTSEGETKEPADTRNRKFGVGK
jgi:hypothetical protein